jgi:hypothetical protein
VSAARLLLGALVLALAGTGLAVTSGGAQEPGRVLELTTRHTGGFRVDNAPRGASPGDLLGFRESVRSGGARFGRDHGTCIAVSRSVVDCAITAELRDGRLVLRLVQDVRKRVNTAVLLGGTGAYRGATGVASVRSTRTGNRIAIEIDG